MVTVQLLKRKLPQATLILLLIAIYSLHAQDAAVQNGAAQQGVQMEPGTALDGRNPAASSVFSQQQDGRHFVTQSTDPSYVLQPQDFIQVVIYQEDDMNTITRISPDGQITFPLLGYVKLGGLTVAEANNKLRTLLMDGYIRNPQVSITVTQFALRRFFVLGEVQKPGSFEMPEQESVSLLQALALAGGYTKIADPGKITVKRIENGKEVIYRLNAKAMARDSDATQFYIKPNDTITVAESLF